MHARSLLSQILFVLACSLAGVLITLMLLAPYLQGAVEDISGLSFLIALFAHDPAVRRTSLASAVGLVVTACIFFRQSVSPEPTDEEPTETPSPSTPRRRRQKSGVGA